MTTALEAVCAFVDGNPGGEWQHFQFDSLFMRDAVREIRALQAEVQSLAGAVTILKGFAQLDYASLHAAQDEIQRLREAIPTISASGAMVAIEANGTISIQADHVEITGTVHA